MTIDDYLGSEELQSFRRISQNRQRVENFHKTDDDHWHVMVVEGNEKLLLKSLNPNLDISLSAIYEGLDLPGVVRKEKPNTIVIPIIER